MEKLNLASKVNGIEIYKFQKVGTKRIFFAPEIEGKRINSTMFARLYDAEKLAKKYLEYAGK